MIKLIKTYTKLLIVFAFRMIFSIIGLKKSGLFKDIIEAIEEKEKVFLTYHIRPIMSSDIHCRPSYICKDKLKYGIVIQGPILYKNDFTLETIKFYNKCFNNTTILLSTWEDELQFNLSPFKNLGIEIIFNKKPSYRGINNINLQITSTKNGVLRAKDLNVKYILKCRTDQRLYAPDSLEYLFNIINLFPVNRSKYDQESRIVGPSLNTFKYRMYGLTDMLLFGSAKDMAKYWDIDIDSRKFEHSQILDYGRTLRSYAENKIAPEVYFSTKFLENIGRTLEWTLRDSWICFKENFCVIDSSQLDLLWPKYYRIENRWQSYSSKYSHQELTFRDWICLYNGIDKIDIPETYLDEEINEDL